MSLDPTNVTTQQSDLATVTGATSDLPTDVGITTLTRTMISLDTALARPVLVASLLDDGNLANQTGYINLWYDWCMHPSTVAKLANYRGIKCDFRVRIEYSPNALLVGRKLWAIQRLPEATNTSEYLHNYRMFRGPTGDYKYARTLLIQRPIHGYTEPSGEGILEFVVKYAHNRQFYDKMYDQSEREHPLCPPFALYFDAEVPIYKMDMSAIGNSTIMYNVYCSVENVELFVPQKVQADRENPYRAASAIVAKASKFANNFGISTTPVDVARKMGDTVASYFGYSKPFKPFESTVDSRVMGELVTFNGTSTALPIADDANDSFATKRTDIVCDVDTEDDSIAYIGSIPGNDYMHSTNISPYLARWSTTLSQGATLGTLVVAPQTHAPTSTFEVPTPGDYLALAFNYWRADEVVYVIDIVANPFYRGTIYVEWEPANKAGAIPAHAVGQAFNQGSLKTANVVFTGSTSFEFSVPWMDSNLYLPTRQYTNAYSGIVHNNLGRVTMLVGAQLRCGLVDSSNVYYSVKKYYKNLQLFDYNPSQISAFCIAPNYDILETQSDKVGAFCFGEQLHSINQIVKIAAPQLYTLQYGDPIDPAGNLDMHVSVPLEPLQPTIATYESTGIRLLFLVRLAHPLPYFSSLFLARSGSVRAAGCLVGGSAPLADGNVWISKQKHLQASGGCLIENADLQTNTHVLAKREVAKGNPARAVVIETKPIINTYNMGGSFALDDMRHKPFGVEISTPLSSSAQGFVTPSYYRIDYSGGESYELRCFQGVQFGIAALPILAPVDPNP